MVSGARSRGPVPNVLAIAGSDPSGGAGIQADLKAISANGGYAMAVITALTAQNTRGVQAVEPVSPRLIAAQIAAIRDDIRIDAIKIGMLGTAEAIEAVADALSGLTVPIVLDPVMVAKGGRALLDPAAVAALIAQLIPRVAVLTPNLPEAAALLNAAGVACVEATDRAGMEAQARAIFRLGPGAILLKGGHLPAIDSPDLLMDGSGTLWLDGARRPTTNTHGTGCTLSSALATGLAHGLEIAPAFRAARDYTAAAIAAADGLDVGHGHGPTDHFFTLRGAPPAQW